MHCDLHSHFLHTHKISTFIKFIWLKKMFLSRRSVQSLDREQLCNHITVVLNFRHHNYLLYCLGRVKRKIIIFPWIIFYPFLWCVDASIKNRCRGPASHFLGSLSGNYLTSFYSQFAALPLHIPISTCWLPSPLGEYLMCSVSAPRSQINPHTLELGTTLRFVLVYFATHCVLEDIIALCSHAVDAIVYSLPVKSCHLWVLFPLLNVTAYQN